jgi:hypothetical protein
MKEFTPESSPPTPFFNGKVYRNAAITIGLSFVGGFLVGMARGMGGFSADGYMFLVAISNLLSCTLGGVISGYDHQASSGGRLACLALRSGERGA